MILKKKHLAYIFSAWIVLAGIVGVNLIKNRSIYFKKIEHSHVFVADVVNVTEHLEPKGNRSYLIDYEYASVIGAKIRKSGVIYGDDGILKSFRSGHPITVRLYQSSEGLREIDLASDWDRIASEPNWHIAAMALLISAAPGLLCFSLGNALLSLFLKVRGQLQNAAGRRRRQRR